MEITVTLDRASLDDVVTEAYDDIDGYMASVTLRDVVTAKIAEALMADAKRWRSLVSRVDKAMDAWLRKQAAGFVEAKIAAEVERQLTDRRTGAMTRGEDSTMLDAFVATEVTTQLRARVEPVVQAALGDVQRTLGEIASQAVADFRAGLRKP